MAILDDTGLLADPGAIEVVRPVGRRLITHAIHDIDGTHSLIRDWPPVMSRLLHWTIHGALKKAPDPFFGPGVVEELVGKVGTEALPETDRFTVESAGLSALTQMEFAVRRAIELGNVPPALSARLSEADRAVNRRIIERIWLGEERFEDEQESPTVRALVAELAPRLFRLYERVLNRASRDANLAAARRDPARWRVPGSLEFLGHLRAVGCLNYFVTGAAIEPGGGMLEEVEALGFTVGGGQLIEAALGSSWDRKRPKDELMRELCEREAIDPRHVLVVGDGRAEVRAGAVMGAVTMSRLPLDARRPRELHRALGTHYIVADYTDPRLRRFIGR